MSSPPETQTETQPQTQLPPPQSQAPNHSKPCTLCHTPRQVLVRCQIDESGRWHFVCPGTCWREVSGGVEDARGREAEYPYYRYGGMWKNKHADGPVSARKPRRVKRRQKAEMQRRAAAGTDGVDGDGEEEDGTEGVTEGETEGDEEGDAHEEVASAGTSGTKPSAHEVG